MILLALLAFVFNGRPPPSSIMRAVQKGGAQPVARPSSGCGTIPPVNGQFVTRTTTFAGAALKDIENTSRSYIIAVPSNAPTGSADNKLHPVAIVFHGATGSSSGAQAFNICNGVVPAADAICVFPQGVSFQGSGTSAWDDSEPNREQWWQPFGTVTSRDTLLFDAVLADVESHFCVDLNRVFVAGFSWGCDMALSLASSRGNVIRAVSAASCAYAFWSTSDSTTYAGECIANASPCTGSNHPGHQTPSALAPALRFTHDPSGDTSYTLAEFTATSQMARRHRNCSATTTTSGGAAGAVCTEYTGCTSRFIECTYSGLGHNPPPNWGPDTWEFFDGFK